MSDFKKNIIESVVNQDLCVGCGACLYGIPNAKMNWNKEGFLIPTAENPKDLTEEKTVQACPFNPFPNDKVRTENELADIFLKEAPNSHPQVGKYFNTYAGYSEQFRLTSSSGGMATYFLSELFEQKMIDAVIAVGEGKNEHYEYKLVKSKNGLLGLSKTKYYPISMAKALQELKNFDGKVAVVGIGCFIKSVRLLQHYYPELRKKIVFTIGIICGGLKSKYFAEYLAGKAGVENRTFTKPQFRIKDYKSDAGDYSFGCLDAAGVEKKVRMKTLGDMWGTGMFKCNACDFCDDVTTELADVSLGDAWIVPYQLDGRGTNTIITRSLLAEEIIRNGIKQKKLVADEISEESLISTQKGSFRHRQNALKYRIKLAKAEGFIIPPKRHDNHKISLVYSLVQYYRMIVRKKSNNLWVYQTSTENYETQLDKYKKRLKSVTTMHHNYERLSNKFRK